MANWKYFVGPGSVFGMPASTANLEIDEAFKEQAAMTAATFERSPENRANLRIYFKTADEVYKRSGRRDGKVPLAIQFGNQIWITSDRDRFHPANSDLRIMRRVIWHETGHYFFGLGNHPDYLLADYIMNINLAAIYPHPWEAVNLWQRRHGVPKQKFFPVPQSMIGREIQRLKASIDHAKEVRSQMVTQREHSTDIVLRTSLTTEIRRLTAQITADNSALTQRSIQWTAVRNQWKSVPMAGP